MALPWLGLGPAALTLVDVDSTTEARPHAALPCVRDAAPALSLPSHDKCYFWQRPIRVAAFCDALRSKARPRLRFSLMGATLTLKTLLGWSAVRGSM